VPFRHGYPLSVIFIGGCVCPLGMSDIHWGLIRMKLVLWKKIVGVIAVVFVLLLWSSPPEWNIQSFALDDVTGDGNTELIMLLWKKGSFGRHKPLWQEREKNNYSCHLFVYQLIKNRLIPRWCSSALDRPIKSFTVEKDPSGKAFLAVQEGYCSTYCFGRPIIIGKECSNWTWKQWGFYRI